jgi:hypothetical protein
LAGVLFSLASWWVVQRVAERIRRANEGEALAWPLAPQPAAEVALVPAEAADRAAG